jgi:hypothetical protein
LWRRSWLLSLPLKEMGRLRSRSSLVRGWSRNGRRRRWHRLLWRRSWLLGLPHKEMGRRRSRRALVRGGGQNGRRNGRNGRWDRCHLRGRERFL